MTLTIMFQSLIGTVQLLGFVAKFGGKLVFQSLIGTVQQVYLGPRQRSSNKVSISHRYSVTTVFTAFSVFIIPHFPCFSTFFSKKVGQPLHCRFSQSLDFTVLEVHRLFYRIFNNLLFECPTLNFYRKPKI